MKTFLSLLYSYDVRCICDEILLAEKLRYVNFNYFSNILITLLYTLLLSSCHKSTEIHTQFPISLCTNTCNGITGHHHTSDKETCCKSTHPCRPDTENDAWILHTVYI